MGAVHERLILEDETEVVLRLVGAKGTLDTSASENVIGTTNEPTKRIKANEIPFVFIEWFL